ncbi:SMC-Scp complex subunit ScpB [Micromonospora sp. NPDC000089]|uniref:SMC-Scp complex subunit ScpB n=1 Tax=unclassified Micromonospora TaxID=2617518 RepID=UPI0036BC9726
MSDEERRDSLADQAAAWIPPWARPTPDPTEEPAPAASAEPHAAADPAVPPAPAEEPAPTDPAEAEIVASSGSLRTDSREDLTAAAPESGGAAEQGEPGGGAPVGEGEAVTPAPAPAEGRVAGAGEAARVPSKERAGRRRATVVPEPAPVLADAELRGALEAILLVVDEPVSELTLAQVLEQSPERIGPVLDDIAAGYTAAGHGFELRRAAGGWRLYTRPEYATYVERFVLDGQSVRLTQAALETLAVIAYRQPVTRSRISAIRGVNCDGVIRTLVSRGLVEECGAEADSGAFLYRTTTMFLEKLGLDSVADLPPLAPFLPDDVEELADATR